MFYDPTIPGFVNYRDQIGARREHKKMSLSSAATCIVSLAETSNWFESSGAPAEWSSRSEEIAAVLLAQSWTSAGLPADNAFSTAFAIEAFQALAPALRERNVLQEERVLEGQRRLLEEIKSGSVRLPPYPPSAFLTQLVYRVIARNPAEAAFVQQTLNKNVKTWAWREIEHQILLLNARSKSADVFQLAYAIILVATTTDFALALPEDRLLLDYALDRFFEFQLPDGSWPRSQPLFHYLEAGNAYCYEYELLVQMLGCEALQEGCLRHLDALARAAFSLENTLFNLQGNAIAWSSGHHPQTPGPESWATASVFHFVHRLDRLLAEAIRRSVFREVQVPYPLPLVPRREKTEFAPGFWDCPLWLGNEPRSLRSTLYDVFVEKVAKQASEVTAGRALSNSTPMSLILFGPPGTSKTELSKAIAEYLGWPRLTVDPSYFVKDGLDRVQTQADKIFDMLVYAERMVVLLDEFDEMVRDRADAPDVLSRFLTTAMLPKLANINRSRRLVFIVATNFINSFDAAISRPGRFDVILQVMPPFAAEKVEHHAKLRAQLEKIKALPLTQDVSVAMDLLTYDEFNTVADRISESGSLGELKHNLTEATKRCTLNRNVYPKGHDKSGATWLKACEEQRLHIEIRK